MEDTGIGVAPDKIDRLFKSFSQADATTTRRFGGTGLGLAISKQLAELMGGEIGVESVEGEGSTFWFTAVLAKPADGANARKERIDVGDARILVVDDNETNRLILREYLRAWGCEVTCAPNAGDGLDRMVRAQREGRPFDIAILDLLMPDVDGLELAQRIRSVDEFKDTPLVLLSSAGLASAADRAKDVGFARCLLKPIRQSSLLECMQSILGAAPAAESCAGPATKAADNTQKALPSGLRILLVEDNATNQKVALHVLDNRLGLRADAVANGAEAIEALRRADYDIVLMDCQMPIMDGYEATRRIRSAQTGVRDPNVRIVAMTANAMKGDRERCLEAGMDDYVAKPVRPQELSEAMHRVLRDKPVEPADAASPASPSAEAAPEGPLVSEFANDPDMQDLVEEFVDALAPSIDAMQQAVAASHWQEVQSLAHQLKGSGGAYGYPALTDAAAILENAAKACDAEQVADAMRRLTSLLGAVLEDPSVRCEGEKT